MHDRSVERGTVKEMLFVYRQDQISQSLTGAVWNNRREKEVTERSAEYVSTGVGCEDSKGG